jgi:hypothetical protein
MLDRTCECFFVEDPNVQKGKDVKLCTCGRHRSFKALSTNTSAATVQRLASVVQACKSPSDHFQKVLG